MNVQLMSQDEQMEQGLLAELKEKYGPVYVMTLQIEEEKPVVLYLKKMDRTVYTLVSKFIQSDEIKAAELMLKNLCISGPINEVVDDFDLLLAAAKQLPVLLSRAQGSIKKN